MFVVKQQFRKIVARLQWKLLNRKNSTSIGEYLFGFSNVKIGDYSYGEINVLSASKSPHLTIGRFCSIAANVTFIISNNHIVNSFSTYPWKVKMLGTQESEAIGKGGIVVGDDVWIGFGATILDGVTIGRGSIIAAGALVTKDVQPYTIVGGVPARFIRKRFEDSIIDILMTIDFSKVSYEFVKSNIDSLYSPLNQTTAAYLADCLRNDYEL